jgi:cytochrome c
MSSTSKALLTGAIALALGSPVLAYDFGRPATPDEIALWDIDVRPDGKGLPPGGGTVAHGKQVFADNCTACHGDNGVGGIKDRLVGGQGTLSSDAPVKTVGSFWPYATTLFDYIHRAMPHQAPGSLSNDDTYSVAAYILHLNGILPADGKLDRDSLPNIKMPNRDGFVPEPECDPAKLFRKK